MFYDIQDVKNGFLTYRNKKFQKFKIEIFPKDLVHGFGQKLGIFPCV